MGETDKIMHGYGPTYERLADRIGRRGRLMEIGTANGDGLRYFYELFKPDWLVGVDINRNATNPYGPMFHAEQDDLALPHQFGNPFDLIVDDASHDNQLTTRTLFNMWHLVVSGGFYVIEDWSHAGMLCGRLAEQLPAIAFENAPRLPDVKAITYQPGLIVIERQ